MTPGERRRARERTYHAALDTLQALPRPGDGADRAADAARRRETADSLRELESDMAELGSPRILELLRSIIDDLSDGRPHDAGQVTQLAIRMAEDADTASVPRPESASG